MANLAKLFTGSDPYAEEPGQGKKLSKSIVPLQTSSQVGGTNWLEQELLRPSVGLGRTETQGLANINRYAGKVTQPNVMQAMAESEIGKTLAGGYNPNTSQYYEGMRSGMKRNLQSGIGQLRQRQQLGGQLYSGRAVGQEGTMIAENTEAVNRLLGGMNETERARMLSAAPVAMQMGNYQAEAPLRAGQAQMQAGAIPRQVALQNRLNKASIASGLTGQNITYAPKTVYPEQTQVDPEAQANLINEIIQKFLAQQAATNELQVNLAPTSTPVSGQKVMQGKPWKPTGGGYQGGEYQGYY